MLFKKNIPWSELNNLGGPCCAKAFVRASTRNWLSNVVLESRQDQKGQPIHNGHDTQVEFFQYNIKYNISHTGLGLVLSCFSRHMVDPMPSVGLCEIFFREYLA